MFYQHNMDTGAWVFMVLANIVIWGLIIVFIVWLVQDLRTRPHRHHVTYGASASEILDRRLASGEINVEEYQRLRTTLEQPTGDKPTETGSPAGAPT
jgi:putative membrane protein